MDTHSAPPAALDGLDPTLRDTYFAEACTPSELRKIDAWMAEHPARKAALMGLRMGLVNPPYPPLISGADMDARIGAVIDPMIATRVSTRASGGLPRVKNHPRRARDLAWIHTRRWTESRQVRIHGRAVAWGGALVLAVATTFGVLSYVRSSSPAAATTYATRAGERTTVVLLDGTRVTMAPQTTVTVPTDFGAHTRVIALSGEAYFDVASAAGHPFVVRTNTVSAQVLGTTFDVRQYRTDTVVQIVVNSGRVSARGHGTPVTLSQGMVARFGDSTTLVSTHDDPRIYTSWMHGQLIFERTPIPTVLTTLGRWYGYEFQLTDSALALQSVSASFSVSDSTEMLASLKTMLGVNMTFHGHVVTLAPRRAPQGGSAGKTLKALKALFKPSMEVGK